MDSRSDGRIVDTSATTTWQTATAAAPLSVVNNARLEHMRHVVRVDDCECSDEEMSGEAVRAGDGGTVVVGDRTVSAVML